MSIFPSPTVPFSEIPAIPQQNLWPGVIPLTLVMIAAQRGTGKGLFIAKVIADVTAGTLFPGEQEGREPGQVLIAAPEDNPNSVLAYRLRAACADLALVRNLTVMINGGRFMLPSGHSELEYAIREAEQLGPKVRLIALDPILAIAEYGLNTGARARAVMEPLLELAESRELAVIASHHTVKSGVIAGSQVVTDIPRMVWRIDRAPAAYGDARLREMTVEKSNNTGEEQVIHFRIDGDGADARAVLADTLAGDLRARKLRLSWKDTVVHDISRGAAGREALTLLSTEDRRAAEKELEKEKAS